jgi:hypothetical protein
MDDKIGIHNDAPDTQHIHILMAYDFAILMALDDEMRDEVSRSY